MNETYRILPSSSAVMSALAALAIATAPAALAQNVSVTPHKEACKTTVKFAHLTAEASAQILGPPENRKGHIVMEFDLSRTELEFMHSASSSYKRLPVLSMRQPGQGLSPGLRLSVIRKGNKSPWKGGEVCRFTVNDGPARSAKLTYIGKPEHYNGVYVCVVNFDESEMAKMQSIAFELVHMDTGDACIRAKYQFPAAKEFAAAVQAAAADVSKRAQEGGCKAVDDSARWAVTSQ